MQNLAYILKGVAVVYVLQMETLKVDTQQLLGQINGDHAWSYLQKQLKKPSSPAGKRYKKRIPGEERPQPPSVRAFNLVDAK